MCGIVGYIGDDNIKNILVDGLKELEYRGYDSSGIAYLKDNDIEVFKAVGKIENLVEKIEDFNIFDGLKIGIAHTRWATHGKPTELNAHPHLGEFSYVVHNGIIENYQDIKKNLIKSGVKFLSQTDTEIIVHLFELNLKNNSFEAFKQTINTINGAYAILLITKKDKDKIFFAKQGSPLIIGKNSKGEVFFASSDLAIIDKATEVIYLEDGDFGYADKNNVKIYKEDKEVALKWKKLNTNKQFAKKDGYRFFMEKEIYEQSEVASEAVMGRLIDNKILFEELNGLDITKFNEIKICACGTSYHSALVGSYLFERLAKVRCSVEIASEFRYKNPYLSKDTLFIVISQSGETADTLEALKMVKKHNIKTLSICNVDNSSMVRISDYSILTRAGIEKGVASTKAFSNQVIILWMLSIFMAQYKDYDIQNEIKALSHTPISLKITNKIHEKTKRLSKRYLHGHGFFFIGRDIFYPLALEGALKLKEISYLHAEGYPAGEMKHGPIALADPELFTIALLPKNLLFDKTKSNIEELSARDSTICVISSEEIELADDFIKIDKQDHYMNEFFEMLTTMQLLAMEISIRLGNDVDMPRNLAKSVTVE